MPKEFVVNCTIRVENEVSVTLTAKDEEDAEAKVQALINQGKIGYREDLVPHRTPKGVRDAEYTSDPEVVEIESVEEVS